jgi:ATP-dependent DNA helicase PIF1
MAKKKIIITKEFKQAFKTMEESRDHVFLTGRAGTGKSTLLKYFRKKTQKKHVVLAPTGVAALNVKGQTVHSFFGFHPRIEKSLVRKAFEDNLPMFKNLEMIIIDEISMVRADLLDCVDRALRLNRGKMKEPFGGVQMVFIGDLYQLPPVVTRDEQHRFEVEYPSPYFFHADAMRAEQIKIIELQKVHRQKEAAFVDLLNNVRTGQVSYEDVAAWNKRHDPFFDPTEQSEHIVHLCTTNKMADGRNQYELKQLESKEWKLKANKYGELGERRMPSEPVIKLKEGARVMFTTNDPERRFVNGSLGTVVRIRKKGLSKLPILDVELEDGGEIEVGQHTWEVFEYAMGKKGRFEEQVVGSYTQYPIVLAWAVTIHKAQGKTFDKVLIDVGWGAFAHGQLYVALSRCTKLKGITLLKPFKKKDVIIDEAVLKFMGEK